ncbi:nickel pincer cofactor biosynthesis protein LarC [Desulfofundulus thermosubterraneus]|uniref:TIGR00299 family protein n=1 Tax=Desulfofundulus thermosubterraneus DSM 16057 TaxID=1121432 RepID=A0A1M6EB32_9FIRM|nr:nickel pincer cofactor biosynthesis protein LarC [Desulfofundulus thermosubterraneus]SHI82724.1 hypothetical protein SAMN02745219_01175 [Desulfofundulus thermosubterraneus DSM 16057]
MKIAYFDCFSGISGDMCLGAIIDAGVNFEELKKQLSSLPVEGYELSCENIKRNGIAAVNVHVNVTQEQPERHLADIEQIIDNSTLPEKVKAASKDVFRSLALAEAKIHATTPDRIHFHEVGAVDAIIDVTGTVLGLHMLGVEKVFVSPLPMGKGFIKCMHGIIPSPAPATLELLAGKNIIVYGTDAEIELVTPTGAAIAATLCNGCGPLPPLFITWVGYGSGKKEYDRPNLLRLIIGTAADSENYGECHQNCHKYNTEEVQAPNHNHEQGHHDGHNQGHDHGQCSHSNGDGHCS